MMIPESECGVERLVLTDSTRLVARIELNWPWRFSLTGTVATTFRYLLNTYRILLVCFCLAG